MKKSLQTHFTSRQFMFSNDFELYYYDDHHPASVSAHSHANYEIYFFLEGDVVYQIDGSSYSLKPRDLLLIPPSLSHHPIFHSSHQSYRRFVLWISPQFYHTLCQEDPAFSYAFEQANERKQFVFHTDTAAFQEMQSRILDLLESTRSQGFGNAASSRLQAASLLLFLNQTIYQMLQPSSAISEKALYLNICNFINRHLDEDLSLERLASFFFVSKYHISHIFKDNMGISAHQYILKKRLQASKNALLAGSSAKEACRLYGFSEYTSFYKAFKKEFGLSPTEYLLQHSMQCTNGSPTEGSS